MILAKQSTLPAGLAALLWDPDALAARGLQLATFYVGLPSDTGRSSHAVAALDGDSKVALLGIRRSSAPVLDLAEVPLEDSTAGEYAAKQDAKWQAMLGLAGRVATNLAKPSPANATFVEQLCDGPHELFHFGSSNEEKVAESPNGDRLFCVHLFLIRCTAETLGEALDRLPVLHDEQWTGLLIYEGDEPRLAEDAVPAGYRTANVKVAPTA